MPPRAAGLSAASARIANDAHLRPEAVLRLQRLAGNQAVQRWLGSARRLARAERPGVSAPAETVGRFETAIASAARDVRGINDTIRQILPHGRFKVGAGEFVHRLEWLVDQLTWVTHALVWARRLAQEASAGGPESTKKLAEAGTHLTAAIFGARAVTILLTYDAFLYDVQNKYSDPKDHHLSEHPRAGARMAHRYLDRALANLSTRSPALVDDAVDELLSYPWPWAFAQMRDETQEMIEAHARVEAWINIAMLAWTAFDLWLVRAGTGGGGFPRVGGTGGAPAAAVATVLTSAESVEALRRLAALGILTSPKFVDLVKGSAGGPHAPPKPIETSTKGPSGNAPGRGSPETPAAEAKGKPQADPKAKTEATGEPQAKAETAHTEAAGESTGKGGGAAGATSGPLEGERDLKVFDRTGREITDIDLFEGKALWEKKSAINATDIPKWIANEITRKFDLYLRARERLPAFYRDATIGFRFSRTPKQEFWNAVWDEIERLRALHPDVTIEVEVVLEAHVH